MNALGKIITFYSYKGGVGRSMALANIGVLLAEMGKKILLVDWDLEAPGLEEYFRTLPTKKKQRTGGLLYLIQRAPDFEADCLEPLVTRFRLDSGNEITLLDSGSDFPGYAEQLASFSWINYFEKYNGGEYLEQLRELWIRHYDFVLIDSRTGITDSGGICTIQMPDTLVLLFSANNQNLQGILQVAKAAKAARENLAFSRLALSILPVPSRFDGRVEQSISSDWLDRFAEKLAPYYEDWLPPDVSPRRLIEQIKIPYIPLYSFDEALPVVTQGISDPDQVGWYYNNLAKLLDSDSAAFSEIVASHDITQLLPSSDLPIQQQTRLSVKNATIMISSTARDLPDHRKEVMDACLRQGMFPVMMEYLPASDAEAISASLKLVDEAGIYVGVLAHRYGYVPKEYNPRQISITEMEYDRAAERKIPRLIFVMDKTHPITIDDVEQGEGALKLKAFKERVQTENIVSFFTSPEDLRAHLINSLAQFRQPDLTTFHYVSDIPQPPDPYIAHPYTLLQTHRLVGRQPELNLLTDWVAKPDAEVYGARILNVVAVGGMGKSALTWQWFNNIAPQEMKPLAGRMWWSFYESDATFENFVTRALAYVTRRPLEEVQQIPAPERETQLLAALDREPFLFVLDGLERILIAYARMDAAHLSDDDYDKQTANVVTNAYGLPASATQSFTGEHRLRKIADPRAGSFLRKLANTRASRILVSTRLYPADLQTVTGEPIGRCFAVFLSGLSDDDALELWRAFGVTGARDTLLPLFNRVGNHPLLVQALASEVARYRPAPGDFDAWRRAHPDFNPFNLPLVQVKSDVLALALRGLDDKAQQVLRTIAAFRMPARYDTLAALLIGEGKPCADERELDEMLTELEDRGLVGWDKRANRYDLHPLVRGVVWGGLGDDARRGVYTSLHAHFESVPMIDDFLKVNSLQDLAPAIELYNTLIGLGRYEDAVRFFYERLSDAMHYRLSASRQRVELLELLFPDGLEQLPRLNRQGDQAYTLRALATGYQSNGQPGRAAALLRRANTICSEMKDDGNLSTGLRNLSYTLLLSGALYESESAAQRALVIAREQDDRFAEASSLNLLGLTLAARGLANESESALQRALRIDAAQSNNQAKGVDNFYLAQRALWLGEYAGALSFANRAWELAHVQSLEGDFIRAARAQGEAALGLNDLVTADERLHHALTRARMVNLVEEELPALVALAELRRRQGDLKAARELLDDVWEAAERGPYPLVHADACNVLAEVERDAGERAKAVEAATRAYRLAWCDGPPFAYHWGLEKARALLRELGAGEPSMPAFDESSFEPMPEVEIDPADEFGVGSGEGAKAEE